MVLIYKVLRGQEHLVKHLDQFEVGQNQGKKCLILIGLKNQLVRQQVLFKYQSQLK